MPEFRAIVVGAGGISNTWFDQIKDTPVQIVAVVDLNPAAAQQQIDKYQLGCRAYAELETAIADQPADFAIDLTIPAAHCKVTTTCLSHGLHVLGEKPMADTLDNARLMIQTARRHDRMYMVGQSRRWNPVHQQIAQTVQQQRLGKVDTVNCDFYLGAHFGGFREQMEHVLLLDMAIHHFDLARLFTGSDAVACSCWEFNPAGSWFKHGAAAHCLFEMTDGSVFDYRGSWTSQGFNTSWNGDWRLIGSQGSLSYVANKVQTAGHGDDQSFMPDDQPIALPELPVIRTGQTGALDEMVAFLTDGRRPQTCCEDNFNSLAMVQAAIQSAENQGQRMTIADL